MRDFLTLKFDLTFALVHTSSGSKKCLGLWLWLLVPLPTVSPLPLLLGQPSEKGRFYSRVLVLLPTTLLRLSRRKRALEQ